MTYCDKSILSPYCDNPQCEICGKARLEDSPFWTGSDNKVYFWNDNTAEWILNQAQNSPSE